MNKINYMQKKYLSPDEAAGGGNGQETAVTPNFAGLSEEMFQPTYEPKEVKAQTEIVEKTAEEVKEVVTDLNLEPEKGTDGLPIEKKEEVPAAEVKPEEKKEEPFELKLDAPVGEAESKVWIETAKEVYGVDLAENTPEAYKIASKEALAAAEERGKQISLDKELAALPPEAQANFILLRDGLSQEEINKPTKVIDDILAMSNIDIIKKDLELQFEGLDPEKREELIDKEIEILTEKGIIDHEAEKLKVVLHQAKESVLREREQLAKSVATNYEAKRIAEKQAELQSVSDSINTVKEFMGFTINDATRAEIVKRNLEGKFESIINDPEKRAKFIMFDLFGEQAVKGIRNKAIEEGREKVTKHLSNIPPVPKHNNSTSVVKQSAKTTTGFEGLEQFFPST